MGIVYMKDKPETESYSYVYVEDSEGNFKRVSKENMKKLLGYVSNSELKETLKKYLSEDDDDEVVSFIENTETGIRVYTRDGDYTDVPISQAKEFETVEFDSENRYLHFYDSEGNDVYEPVHIEGGGGGGSSSSTVKLTNQNGTNTFTVADGSTVPLMFDFSSTESDIPTGDGNCQITVNGVVKATFGISQGLNTVDVSKYLASGSNTVRITCTDIYGNYKSLIYKVSVIEMYITSTFDANVPYNGDITYKYTPYGSIEKIVHILVDGNEVESIKGSTSGRQFTYIITALTHGIHTLDVYATATLNEQTMESKHLVYEVMCTEEGNTSAMISSVYDVTNVSEGTQVSIPYIVLDPAKLSTDVTLDIYTIVDGEEAIYSTQTITVDRTRQHWNTRRYPVGTVYFRIAYGQIKKVHQIEVVESSVNVEPETNDLELSLNSEGRSNGESNPAVWTSGDYTTEFSGFNWIMNGWLTDETGDSCLRLNGDAKAEIQFKPFDNDIRTHGKTLEIEFAIRNANNRKATVINCLSGGIGFEINADTAYIRSEQSEVNCKYKDETKVKLAFVVEARSEYRQLSIYLNGILSDVVQYPDSDNFQQKEPVNIVIGSPECGVDIYNIRSYSTALNASAITNNYIADIKDVIEKTEAYERNDIYDEYGNLSFENAKTKNSVMVIVGELSQSKGDKKKVRVKYYDIDDPSIDYIEDDVTLDVQGTSSQYYARKNWKLKYGTNHYIDKTHLPAKVICIKVDYAESTGTHNTQNAVFVETLYSEKIPPQDVDPKCRTTIYGKPILLFHQKDENSEPTFYAKANYNYDKGAEHVFGFTSDYDVECWEFCNNTSDACNFLAEIPENWGDDFEARYPEDCTDITRFKQMHDWVVSTRRDTATGAALDATFVDQDGTEYTTDTAEYRLAKFKKEFEEHFDMHYALIYYVYTFFALMVDQRAKNMFLTYWASKNKWYAYFYDNDTCFGINNEGQLVFDYYHEDTDKLNGANVYNGQNSVLWCNFRDAFQDKIKETYQNLRNNGYITYDKLVERFITNGSDKWSESIYNEDSDFKYIAMLRTAGDATNLSQVRGSGEEHFRYMVENRLNYCDSKWYASDYANDYISLRIYTPEEWTAVEPNAAITITPFSDMYAGVRYKANGSLLQERVQSGIPVTFGSDITETFNDTETAIYGAHQVSSIGDLAPLYCGSINVSNADKLMELKVGDGTEGYANTNLIELSVGQKKFLRNIDVQNCPNFSSTLDLSGCPNIEEVYAKGSGITGIDLPEGGILKKIQLPATITNFTIKRQIYVDEVTFEGYDKIKTLWVEGCPTIDSFDILSKSPNVERLRITNVKLNYDTAEEMIELASRPIRGIDENGTNVETMWIDGTCHIKTLTGSEYAAIKAAFPYLTITYDHITSYCYFYNYDGSELLYTAYCADGSDASYRGSTPTRPSTAQYNYTHSGWSLVPNGNANSNALKDVTADRNVYAAFQGTIRTYTVYFYNGSTLLQTVTNVAYGSSATYTGDTPVSPDGSAEDYPFEGWNPEPKNITGTTSCYAKFGSPLEVKEITDSWETIITACADGSYRNKYKVGNYKALDLGAQGVVNMQIAGVDKDTLADGSGKAPLSWISKELLTTSHRMNPSLVTNYGEYYIKEGSTWSEESTNVWKSDNAGKNSVTANATLKISVITAGTLKLWYKVGSEANYDKYTVKVNGTTIANAISGEVDWTEYDITCNANDEITVSVSYSKDGSGDKNGDTAYVKFESDDVVFTVTASSNGTQTRDALSYDEGTGSIGGWEKSEMRAYLKETVKPLIPDVVRNAIVEVTKTQNAYNTSGSSYSQTTTDDVWIPDYYEVFSNLYLYKGLFPDNASRIKYKVGATSASWWWLRRANGSNYFNYVSSGGSYYNYYANYTYGVALGFCT